MQFLPAERILDHGGDPDVVRVMANLLMEISADFAHKLMGLGQTIGPAFADFAPGLAPFDWLVGIVGAATFRLLIYFNGLTPAPNGIRIMPFGQMELSQYLNVNRSALNRELSRMKEEGVIEMDGHAVRILKAGE